MSYVHLKCACVLPPLCPPYSAVNAIDMHASYTNTWTPNYLACLYVSMDVGLVFLIVYNKSNTFLAISIIFILHAIYAIGLLLLLLTAGYMYTQLHIQHANPNKYLH